MSAVDVAEALRARAKGCGRGRRVAGGRRVAALAKRCWHCRGRSRRRRASGEQWHGRQWRISRLGRPVGGDQRTPAGGRTALLAAGLTHGRADPLPGTAIPAVIRHSIHFRECFRLGRALADYRGRLNGQRRSAGYSAGMLGSGERQWRREATGGDGEGALARRAHERVDASGGGHASGPAETHDACSGGPIRPPRRARPMAAGCAGN